MKNVKYLSLFLGLSLLILSSSPVAGAAIQGTWNLKAIADSGDEYDLILTLSEVDGKVSGTLGTYEGSVDLNDVEFDGTILSFSITTPEAVDYRIKLKLDGDTLEGTFSGDNNSAGKVTAKRSH